MKRGVLIAIIVIVLLFISFAVVGGFIYLQITREQPIPKHSYLEIDLAGGISDNDNSAFSRADTIRDYWYHLKRAKIDRRISGIILNISYLATDFAKTEELGLLIKDFKKSGKPVYAFIEGGGIREYYLASFADQIYLFKGGSLFLSGLAVESTFLKNTLSKLGIQAEMFHIGKYKTAANMFTEDRMTTAHEESLGKLLEDIFNYTLKQIAVNRKLELDTVKAVFDKSPILNDAYLEAGLIDHIGYEDEMYDELPSSRRISFHIYKQTKKPRPYRGSSKIAVIFASGEIHSGKSGGTSLFGGDIMGSDTVARQLRAVRRNPFVKAVVLRVDSPGGSSAASEVIRREAELLAKEKPLVISMSGLAASGGYWISMASPNIMALPQTITGSIGVVTGKFVLKGLYDKVGISKDIIKTSKYADIFSDYRVFNEDEKIKINKMMQSIYQTFLETVSTNRKMTVEEVDKLARGRIWSGSTAKELKLVDKLGGLDDAIEEAKRLAVIPPGKRVGIKIYPRKKSFMDYIFDLTGTKAKVAEVSAVSDPIQVLEKKIAMYKNFFPALMVPYKLTVK